MTLFNSIEGFEIPETGFKVVLHGNLGGLTVFEIDECNGKINLGMREATALRDWLNRAIPQDANDARSKS